MEKSVTVEELVSTLDIEILFGEEFKARDIISSEVSRPGLILTGYKDFYPHERIQLIGRTEISYINSSVCYVTRIRRLLLSVEASRCRLA